PTVAQPLPNFLRDSLPAYLSRGLQRWQIPGAAVCVVKDGQVLLAQGFGTRQMGQAAPVDANTLFMIGSNTKAFTGTALAWLEHEKKWNLRDPVQKWLPGFTMQDPWVAQHLVLTDLVSHRMGLATFQGDFMYWTSTLAPAQVIQKFGQLKPAYPLRTRWGYTNAGYVVAGECLRTASGLPWADFMRQRFFQPLQMTRTLATSVEAEKADNLARPHSVFEGRLQAIPWANIDNLSPAGSIASSVNDLSHWLLALLDSGRYQGQTVIPYPAIERTRQPQSIMGRSRAPGQHYQLYGLGWMLEDYHGREVVSHTGGVNGFVTSVTLVPEERLGIVVLTNTDSNSFYESLKRDLLTVALGLPYLHHDERYFQQYRQAETAEKALRQALRDSVALKRPPSLPLATFAGTYTHPVYGWAKLEANGSHLVLRLQHHAMTGKLEHLDGHRFLCTYSDPTMGIKVLPFKVEKGKVAGFELFVADFIEYTGYEFVKQP
ncbi:MAG: serine hydrolase, partial [Bernardetiaceae bacterium]|nr:serine hydrolase [Bernardetiaceae bacterium]